MIFQRDDAVHVAVGCVLFTVAVGVITADVIAVGTSADPSWCVAWFWALLAPSSTAALAGGYMLTAPYTGLRLPSTYRERTTRPSLKLRGIYTIKVLSNRIVFQVGLENDGPVDLNVNANVLVPEFVDYIATCAPDGTGAWTQGPKMTTSERLPGAEEYESIYWESGSEGIRLPARTAVPIYLCIGLSSVHPVPVKAKFWSSQLPEPLAGNAVVGSDTGLGGLE